MLKHVKHYISVGAYSLRMSFARQLEYPSFLICWVIGNPLNYMMGVWMIGVITQRFQALNGWTYPQIAFLYGISLLSHSLSVLLFIQTWGIERMVIRGSFDRFLVRPVGVFFQFCIDYINLIGFTDMIPGVIIFVYGSSVVNFEWTFFNTIKILLVLVGATLIRGATYTILGSVAFWTKSSRSLISMVHALFERTTYYPLSIYPTVIQVIFTFLLPFGFISFYPACEFLGQDSGFDFPLEFALWTPVVGVILEIIAVSIFNRGLKKYESAGS
ncbi:MAG: transporter permease [Herbinix sp.]|nr:transporter permease [Herbinix sp.]